MTQRSGDGCCSVAWAWSHVMHQIPDGSDAQNDSVLISASNKAQVSQDLMWTWAPTHIFWPRWLYHIWFRHCVNYNPGGNPRSWALSSHTPGTQSQGRTEHISSAAVALMGIKWNTLVHTHWKSDTFVGPGLDGEKKAFSIKICWS